MKFKKTKLPLTELINQYKFFSVIIENILAYIFLLFRLFKRPLRPKTEDLIHGIGFAALMVLFILITVVDVKRFW